MIIANNPTTMNTSHEGSGIAIVGMAVQLPSGRIATEDLDYTKLWEFLLEGKNAFEPVESFLRAPAGSTVKLPMHGAFLKNASSFDNIALGIGARDARVLPYSGRRLLDLSFQALLDSGIDSRGQSVGCFMSGNRTLGTDFEPDADGSFGWMLHAFANRISYALDLTGPSIFLDTACSSSLTGLHLAITSLERGDCSAALVGAAQINRDPVTWVDYVQGGVLSADGICKPFDEKADGFGRGEGAVVVVLKPFKDALRDNDHVYSVILGSAINATGSHMPLNVPSGRAQELCIHEAYKRAGIHPDSADYVELHATGTLVGDPIETNAAGPLFAKGEISAPFGSIKGNIGHLEVAAFLASLVKACLIFEHGIIPPTVNLSSPSRGIKWDEFNAHVPTEATPLGCRSSSGRSIISLSGAGIGGSTGHVVLQSPPTPPGQVARATSSTAPVLLLVGGLSAAAVSQIAEAASRFDSEDLSRIAVTLSRRARQLPWRTYFTLPLSSSIAPTIPPAVFISNTPPPIALVFSGQGPQNTDMGRQLFAGYRVFRETILELDDVYRRVRGSSLIETTGLFMHTTSPPTIELRDSGWPVTITVSAIAMIQMALFDLLHSVGVRPDMLFGHSAGETTALYASGAGSKAMALEIAIARGEAMTCTEGPELGMAMIACDAERAKSFIAQIMDTSNRAAAGVLELSCYNTPESVVVSGTASLLNSFITRAKDEGLFAQRIRTMVPGHCSLMDPIKNDYLARMENIFAQYPGPHVPEVPVFSTCQGKTQVVVKEFTPMYFWDNCRNAVQFSSAVGHSLTSSSEARPPVFLEISCHPVLSTSISAHGVSDSRVLCPMRRISAKTKAQKATSSLSSEPATFLDTLGQLSLLGHNSLDLSGLYGFSALKPKPIEHPLVPRLIPPPKSLALLGPRSTSRLNDRPLSSSGLNINRATHPDLAEHVINGEPVFPATAFIEMLLETGANFLWDVEFASILSLAGSSPLEVSLRRLDFEWSVNSSTGSDEREREHARGCFDNTKPSELPPVANLAEMWENLPSLDFNHFYTSLEPLAAYGPRFQRIVRCHGGPMQALAEIRGPSSEEIAQNYALHPVILDACLHVVLHPGISKEYSKDVTYLPSRLEHFVFYRRECGSGNWFSHIHLQKWTPDYRYYDVFITDSTGLALCEIRNLVLKKFISTGPVSVKRRFDLAFQPAVCCVEVPQIRPTFSQKPNNNQVRLLYSVLDFMATEMIAKSLERRNIVTGGEESRMRYLSFARRALEFRKENVATREEVEVLRSSWPHHFSVTERVAAVHESVFEGPQHAVEALYSDSIMADFYREFSQTSNVCSGAADVFSGLLASLRASGKRSVKVLELGAGTGLLTRRLLEQVQRDSDTLVEYTVTDISFALAANLARNLSHPFISAKAYDIGKDPKAQGFPPQSYDLVVGLDVLHTAPNLTECLASLQKLLIPGGSLLIVELDGASWMKIPGSVWFDCIFGSFPEWFGYTDGRAHCTIPPASWKKLLEHLNFINVQTCIEDGCSGRDFFFVAQKSLLPSTTFAIIEPQYIHTYRFGNEIELQEWAKHLDRLSVISIHILALQGRDSDAAIGLCASLRKEFAVWDIRLCIFQSEAHISHPIPHISQHNWTFDCGDNVVWFDTQGAPHVLRLVLSSTPSEFPQLGTPLNHPSTVKIRVSKRAGRLTSYDCFVGEVMSGNSCFAIGESVGGIGDISSSGTVHISSGNILPIPKDCSVEFLQEICCILIASFLPTHVVKSRKTRVLLAIQNPELAAIIRPCVANSLPFEFVAIDLSDHNAFERVDIVFTDSGTFAKYPYLRRCVPRTGQPILWDEILKTEIARDPLYLQNLLAEVDDRYASSALKNKQNECELSPPSRRAAPPFRSDCTYVLLGGIGGLGIDLAVWLYEHGARHLLLTSRRGLKSLDLIEDAFTLAKLAFLQNQEDVDLRLEACDATDSLAMSSLIESLHVPIAGCFQMTLVLSDAPFLKQTERTFCDVYNSKLRVFEVFAAQVDVESLDFYVAFSSISGLVGINGQSNYASACTALDGALSHLANAFSMITPGISDAGYLDRVSSSYIQRRQDLTSMPAKELWACLEDGLRKLSDGPFNQYIPDLNWNLIDAQFTLPRSYKHLMAAATDSAPPRMVQSTDEILIRVLQLLEVSADDFDPSQPLTLYGLDSVSAASLSSLLRPYAGVSQMQLLGGATWIDITANIRSLSSDHDQSSLGRAGDAVEILLKFLDIPSEDFSPDIPLSLYGLDSLGASRLAAALQPYMAVTQMQLIGQTTWTELSRAVLTPDLSNQPLIEICSGPGTPLIILPGANGSLTPFLGLRQYYQGPVWGIQVTDSTPFESLPELVEFWRQQIHKKFPRGPYRLATFSASALAGVLLAKMFEDEGAQVSQLVFIENCPALWTREEAETLLRERTEEEFCRIVDDSVLDMLRNDPSTTPEAYSAFETAVRNMPNAPEGSRREAMISWRTVTLIYRFLHTFYPATGVKSYTEFIGPFTTWLSSVKAPLAVLIAEHGILHSSPGGAWPDLGASRFRRPATVHRIYGAGHWSIFATKGASEILQM